MAALLTLAVLAAWTVPGAARAQTGATLFQQHCAPCHQATGTGVPGAFPPLAGNPVLKDAPHVRSIIENGLSGKLQVGNESFDGTMPAFGDQLTSSEIQALIGYVRSAWGNDYGASSAATAQAAARAGGAAGAKPAGAVTAPPAGAPRATSESTPAPAAGAPSATSRPAAPAPESPAATGDATAGQALFSGRLRLRNGGPPCSACHTVQGENPLGGGTMGRDLTTAYDRLGQKAGLQGVLTNIGFPVMRQAFAERPLTPTEIADLVAYLRQTAATEQHQGTASRNSSRFGFNWLWIFGAGGAAVLFAFLLFGWPRQRESVAQHLRRTGRLGRHRR